MKKSVCFFGSFVPFYSRNLLTAKAFKELGWEVIHCNERSGGIFHNFRLFFNFLLHSRDCPIIFVPVLGHFDIPIAWVIAKIFSKKLIFDAFYSVYDAYVLDRQLVSRRSIGALRYLFYDKIGAILPDRIILDTKENINFYKSIPKVKHKRYYELPVSVDPSLFKFSYTKPRSKVFRIGFYGSFLPLHGIENIIEAMAYLKEKNIKLTVLGYGQKLNEIKKIINQKKLQKIITLKDKMLPYKKLNSFYKSIDLFLAGPFGVTEKAGRVLPAKAVESLSIGLPTIVMETECTKRMLKNYKGNIYWLKKRDSKKLADKIIWIKNNQQKIYEKYRNTDYFSKSNLSFSNFVSKLDKIVTFKY